MNRLNLYTVMLEVATSHPNASYQDILTKTRITLELPFISLSDLKELDLTMPPIVGIQQALNALENEKGTSPITCRAPIVAHARSLFLYSTGVARHKGKTGLFKVLLYKLSGNRRIHAGS